LQEIRVEDALVKRNIMKIKKLFGYTDQLGRCSHVVRANLCSFSTPLRRDGIAASPKFREILDTGTLSLCEPDGSAEMVASR